VKIIYITSLLHDDGIDHVGRSLTRHLDTEHDVLVCGAIVQPGSGLLAGRMSDYVVSAEMLSDTDVVYMEGGWTDGVDGTFQKFPLELAEEFVRCGGQLIAADVARDSAPVQRQSLEAAKRLFGATIGYGDDWGHTGIRKLYDPGAEERYGTRFFTSQMFVSERLRPAMAEIDSILAGGPVQLQLLGADIAASGNLHSTDTLVDDYYQDQGGICPWASVNEFGQGHAMLIGAWVSHDLVVDECPDNARWISNMIGLLTDRSRETAGWLVGKKARSRSVADLSDLLNQPESQWLERKSSFLVPTDSLGDDACQGEGDLRARVQHAVFKSIAALANANGGHVIIGQDDHRKVLGLAKDFATVRNQDQDGFEQRLVQYADNRLHPRWESLGLKVHWIATEAGDVAIIEVPPQPKDVVVWLTKSKGGPEELYVRRGTRSDSIAGRDLSDWLGARRRPGGR
jgi:hypothetical protein